MPSQGSSPDLPTKHGWTHRPKKLGGTDQAGTLVEHEGTVVGYRGAVDFVDSDSLTWTVTDDETNDAVTVEATAAGGGGGGNTAIDLRNPTVGAYFALKAFTGVTIGSWFYKQGVLSSIAGAIMCPSGSTFGVSLGLVSSTASTGNVVIRVSTRAVTPGVNGPGGTFVAETDVVVAIGTNLTVVRVPTSGNLGSAPAAGDLLEITVARVGTDGSDTLADDLMMMSAILDVA